MKINLIGSFTTGYIGESADEIHIANEFEYLGHQIKRIPRDIWKAFVDGENNWPDITNRLEADINIICKWPHFDKEDYIQILKHKSGAPVFYWVWDYMVEPTPDWHHKMAMTADLYLGNDVQAPFYRSLKNCYYFPFDCADASFDRLQLPKKYPVTFFGSYLLQGDRATWIPQINEKYPVKIFSWNYQEWQNVGMNAEPPVWGEEFARQVGESKIILGFNVNDHCWGYWSNRTGKILSLGGFLLQRYAPGMELFLRDGAEYFSSVDECVKKINYFLNHNGERERVAQRGYEIGRDRFTSRARVKELCILMERFLKGGFSEYRPTEPLV